MQDVLTNREQEVAALAALGMSNDEIAARMVISVATARTHASRAMTKLQAHDRAQLVVLVYETASSPPDAPLLPRPPGDRCRGDAQLGRYVQSLAC